MQPSSARDHIGLSRRGREQQAISVFKDGLQKIQKAAELGFLRFQFMQDVPVSLHDTDHGKSFERKLHALGFQTAWVPRKFEASRFGNSLSEAVHVLELRVWWHNGHEDINLPNPMQVYEGSDDQNQHAWSHSYEPCPKSSKPQSPDSNDNPTPKKAPWESAQSYKKQDDDNKLTWKQIRKMYGIPW